MQDNLITFLKGYYIFFKDKLLIYFMIFIFCKDDSWVKKCKICFFLIYFNNTKKGKTK